jgi:hypothetical protein
MAKKDRRHLPIIVHAFSRSVLLPMIQARVVRVFPSTKFSHEWEVCVGENIFSYQVMHRGLSKKQLEKLDAVLAGSAITALVEKEMDSTKRVRITSINNHPFET